MQPAEEKIGIDDCAVTITNKTPCLRIQKLCLNSGESVQKFFVKF